MDLVNENILHIKEDDFEFLKFKDLNKYENIEHAFSLKPYNFRKRAEINDEYKCFFDKLKLDFNSLVKPNQNHTDNILVLDNKVEAEAPDINLEYLENVDALITNKKNIALATTSADCLCIFLYDYKKEVIANIHSGWRGTFKKIAQKAAKKMIEVYSSNPRDIKAFFMPAIRKCHFEVDYDVMSECKIIFEYTNKLDEIIEVGRIIDGKQKYNIDNILINRLILKEVGILDENIVDSGICSVCNKEKIHSRRADGLNFGLGTSIIMMK